MAKYLKDILKQAHDTIKGVRPSETGPLSVGKDPGVDYKPKAEDEADFIAKHSVQKWDEPYGNPNYADKVGYVLKKPEEKRHGNTETKAKATNEETINEISEAKWLKGIAAKRAKGIAMATKEETEVSESKKAEDIKCNMSEAGTRCPMHEMADCSSSRTIKEDEITELSTDTYHRAAHKAAKRAMGDVQGRSGPIFKKYATMANKFRDKGMSQEKKEKAAKAVKEEAVNEISTKLALSYDKGARKSMDTAAAKGSAGHETFMKRSAGQALALDKTNPEHKRLKAKVGTSDANAKDAAYKKAIGEEVIDEKLTDDAKKVIRGALRGPEMKKTSGPARAMIQIAKMSPKNVKEDLAVPLLGGDQKDDESAEMVKAELKAIANQAMNLVMQIPDTMIIEPWVQSKIAQAKIMISGVHDYMVYGDHDKPEEDEQTDTPLTLPNMSVDVNTGQNV